MNNTPRLGLNLLSVGQAQKELAHNEAIQTLDSLVAAAVEDVPINVPPADAAVGQCYIVGDDPAGEWAGNAHFFAAFTSAGWRVASPREGMTVYVRSTGTYGAYRAGAWEIGNLRGSRVLIEGQQVVGPRAAAIGSASGGSVVDGQARNAIDQILVALRQHGLIAS